MIKMDTPDKTYCPACWQREQETRREIATLRRIEKHAKTYVANLLSQHPDIVLWLRDRTLRRTDIRGEFGDDSQDVTERLLSYGRLRRSGSQYKKSNEFIVELRRAQAAYHEHLLAKIENDPLHPANLGF